MVESKMIFFIRLYIPTFYIYSTFFDPEIRSKVLKYFQKIVNFGLCIMSKSQKKVQFGRTTLHCLPQRLKSMGLGNSPLEKISKSVDFSL